MREEVRAEAVDRFLSVYGTERGAPVSVVIPAYREAQTVGGVLSGLPEVVHGLGVEAIVVDDGSQDETGAVAAQAGARVVRHERNLGQGDALRTGFNLALWRGAEVVVTMDADGQHQGEALAELVAPIVVDEADYVQGSRYLGRYEEAGGMRDRGVAFFTRLINLLTGTRVTDCASGLRAIRGQRLPELRLREGRFSAPEILIEAARRGLRIAEVPMNLSRRSVGRSHKPRGVGYPLGFLWVIVKVWARRS